MIAVRPPDAVMRGMLRRLGRRLKSGTVVVRDAAGEFELGTGAPVVHVTVHDARAYGALRRASLGLGEAYQRGWWDVDDLTALIALLVRGLAGPRGKLDRVVAAAAPVIDPVVAFRRVGKERDRRNVRAHYDIGNDFYSLMLDETMTYSCAVFDHADATLADAQTAKLDRICRKLSLGPGDRVVEVGSGWGSFAVHAARRYGCSVTTTTISAAQHDYVSKLVAEVGLADRITVLDRDYRDLTGTYDHLVSVEMIEAVDWRDHAAYFSACARLLAPGGTAALQAIVIADESYVRAKYRDDFVRRHVFPGGCLPSLASITAASARQGLQIVDVEDIGHHYPETLRRWRDNLGAAEAMVRGMGLDATFHRTWEMYLSVCEAAFAERHIGDVQIVMKRPSESTRV